MKKRLIVDLLFVLPFISLIVLSPFKNHLEPMKNNYYFMNPEILRKAGINLTEAGKNNLYRLFGKDTHYLFNPENGLLVESPILRDFAVRLKFNNDLAYENIYHIHFYYKDENNYAGIRLRTGPFEEIEIYEVRDKTKRLISRNMIPLAQNRWNVFQIVLIDDHFFLFLNKFLVIYFRDEFSLKTGIVKFDYHTSANSPENHIVLYRKLELKLSNLLRNNNASD